MPRGLTEADVERFATAYKELNDAANELRRAADGMRASLDGVPAGLYGKALVDYGRPNTILDQEAARATITELGRTVPEKETRAPIIVQIIP